MIIQKIKSTVRGAIGWAVIAGVAIPFAVFGVSPYVGSSITPQDMVVVGERGFDRQQIIREVQIQRNKLIKLFGQGKLPDNFDEDRVFNMALSEMVATELARQYSTERNMTVGDQQLVDYIRAQPELQGDAGFERQKFNDMAVEQGLNASQFERRYRESIVRKQIETPLGQSYFVSPADVRLHNLILAHERDVTVYTLPDDFYLELADISEEQIADYHSANADQFMAPAQIALEYIVLDRQLLAEKIEVSEQELQTAYDQQEQVAGVEEKRKARHILISLPEDAAQDAIDEAYGKVTSLRAQLDEGADFSDLAREHSDDPGSAAQGGDLGEVSRGVMVKPFEEALFALATGQVSEIVTTQFGLHLILLDEVIAGGLGAFDEAKDELTQQVAEEKSFQIYEEELARLNTSIAANAGDLEKIATAMSLELVKSEMAEQGSLPLPFAGFDDRLFLPELTKEDSVELSELIEISDSQSAIARVIGHIAAQPRELDEVRDDIIVRLKEQYAQSQRKDLRLKIETKLAVTDEFSALTDADLVPLERTDFTGVSLSQTKGLSSDAIKAIFSMRLPGAEIGLSKADDANVDGTGSGESAEVSTDATAATDDADQMDIEVHNTAAEADEAAQTDAEAGDSQIDAADPQAEALDAAAEPVAPVDDSLNATDDSAPKQDKDYAYGVLGDKSMQFIIVRTVRGADAEALEQARSNARSQISSMQANIALRTFYNHLRDNTVIDYSGLQAGAQ
ncbi:MAG: peptidylprolyl isomerase [Gammaproteobacteria bacterium]|nr:peptidylprolyl isomerase [Gammaproteobacteria bacterium]